MAKLFQVTGMSCAACSTRVEKAVRSVPGAKNVSVNLLTGYLRADIPDGREGDILSAVEKAGYGAFLPGAERAKPEKQARGGARLAASAILLLPLMIVSMGGMLHLPLPHPIQHGMTGALLQLLLSLPILFLNRHFFTDGFRSVFRLSPNMNSLVSIGSAAGLLYSLAQILLTAIAMDAGTSQSMPHLYFESSAMILVLISVGKYLEARAKGKTGDAISRLARLSPDTAIVLRDGAETEIPLSALAAGDIAVVREGASVPADGQVASGHGSVDCSMLTGESLPVEVAEGDDVACGTVSRGGYFTFRVTQLGSDTQLSRIIRLVEDATASKAPVSRLADRVSAVFVPIVMAVAVVTFVGWLLAGSGASYALSRGIAVLVISCPCALGLATPTAIMVGMGKAAELGILIKSAADLEAAHGIETVAFDKTGTLTRGELELEDAYPVDVTRTELLRAASSVEQLSAHPLSRAIVAACPDAAPCRDFETVPGQGVTGMVADALVAVGSPAFVRSMGADTSRAENWIAENLHRGAGVLACARDGLLLGAISVRDKPRATARQALTALRELGVRSVILTGDAEETAQAIAGETGADDVRSRLLPGDKRDVIASLAEDSAVMMVGDGINDAPALAQATLGAAMGGGTDVAIESAGVVFLRSEPVLAAEAIRLGRATMKNIRQNLFWAFFYNLIGIPVAAGALAGIGISPDPMFAAAAMSLSSVTVVTNALRLRRYRPIPVESCPIPEKKEEIPMNQTVFIEGMMCQHCVMHVTRALTPLDPAVKVDLATKTAVLSADAPETAIRAAVTDAGYEVVRIEK